MICDSVTPPTQPEVLPGDCWCFEGSTGFATITVRGPTEGVGRGLASPPGHSPKAERWPGTDSLRMLQNYTKTGVISKTPCTFREFVRAHLDIRPFQFTSTMTSAIVTATDTFNDAVKYALERVGKAGMVLLVRDITATQAVLSGTT